MPGDTTYRVVLSLSTEGSLATTLGDMAPRADRAESSVRRLGESGRRMGEMFATVGESVGGALEKMADKAIDVGMSFGKAGLAVGIAAATYGVAGLNNELEQTQISMAAVAQAQGFTATFADGMAASTDQLQKMKQDIKTLPGDLGQLSTLFTTIATPAAQAKASLDDIRTLAGKTMLTAAILKVPQEVASREMAQLLSGRAGAHNILGTRLGLVGDAAKQFNAESPEKRLAKINEEMNKYQGAADRFGQSFVANWTTLKDNIKYVLLAPATAPLFEHVKVTLAEINTYFDRHKEKIEEITHTVGARLAQGWDTIVHDAERLEPIVMRLVERISHLNPNEVAAGLKHAGEGILAMKLGGAAITAGSSAIPGVMKALSTFGMLGGGAAGGGGGAAAGGGVAGLLASAGGPLAVGAATLGTFAVGAAGAVGAVDSLTNATAYYHTETVNAVADLRKNLGTLAENATPAYEELHRFVDALGLGFVKDTNYAVEMLNRVSDNTHAWGDLLGQLQNQFRSWADIEIRQKFDNSMDVPGEIADKTADAVFHHLIRLAPGEKLGGVESKAKPGAGGGGGGVNIAHLEIRVEGNGDPERVARLAWDIAKREANNPRSSSRVPRWDAGSHR